jgi:hypothetical protein
MQVVHADFTAETNKGALCNAQKGNQHAGHASTS